ncbi:zinc-ribbon domain-containing protein [Breoghania sp. L-A4]|uniref:zinc-ribbon domain-containing protein n=1 Tax=Breoghania sp. L-A4 TaxID=2304600 RepID=UPI000E35AD59|nr:zinc-ribbon domain-containing protein [Breoghania sp. L-A4]AXS38751.1 hypothetical protein D1F64_00110 [Breoghania sp. L-A4]
MKITCPSCDTSYNIGAASVGAEGRSVRCSRCSEEWYIDAEGRAIAAPADDVDAAADKDDGDDNADWAAAFDEATTDGASAAKAASDDDWKSEIGLEDDGPVRASGMDRAMGNGARREMIDARPKGFGENDLEEGAEPASGRDKNRKRSAYDSRFVMSPEMRAMTGLVLFLSSVVLCVGVILLREPIVRTAPNMAGLYSLVGMDVNLRGLEFHDLRTYQEYENGGVVLIVEGNIENIRKRSTHVPAVKLSLRSSDAQEIYTWKIEPRVRRLPAGQNMRFSTRVASPPEIASDVEVSFIDRNNSQTNL